VTITLRSVFTGLRRHPALFAGIFIACTVVSVIWALLARPVYRAQAVVAPVADNGAMGVLGGLAGQLGGLASIAGVSLGKGQNWTEAVAILRSRHLIERLVTTEDLLPVLFADTKRRATLGDAVKLFQAKILAVQEDPRTGLVTVRVEWYDRYAAADWANMLVFMADKELRAAAIDNATASLESLQQQIDQTQAIELRTAISRLIEAQMKAKLAASVQKHYAFRVIDPAVVADPDKRVQPTRTTMVLAGALLGLLIGLFTVALRAELARKPE